jgi:hypothetical protein
MRDMAAVLIETRKEVIGYTAGEGHMSRSHVVQFLGRTAPRRSKTERERRRGTPDYTTKHKLKRGNIEIYHTAPHRESPRMLKMSARQTLPPQRRGLVLSSPQRPIFL